jgi:hypothetical protein
MATSSPIPATVGTNGITFTVQVDYIKRECFISNEALQKLADRKGFDGTPEAAFRAMEPAITGVARRMVHARVGGTPLLLNADTFH